LTQHCGQSGSGSHSTGSTAVLTPFGYTVPQRLMQRQQLRRHIPRQMPRGTGCTGSARFMLLHQPYANSQLLT